MESKTRNCSGCGDEINYSTIYTKRNADKKNAKCKSCASSGKNNGMYGAKGVKNPFYGKTHTTETIEKLKNVDRSYTQTEEFRLKQSELNSGNKNNMYGKSVYSVWVDKYGESIANEKKLERSRKQSENSKGENNNMYGKASPMGSGNGWSGWYKGWYFRSLRELTYMVEVIERFDLKWESAETNKWVMQYEDYSGQTRNYFMDFIIGDKYLVEIKPKRLWYSDSVIRKRDCAIKYCEENGLIYKLRDITCLSGKKIASLRNLKLIKFIDRYEQKYKERYEV